MNKTIREDRWSSTEDDVIRQAVKKYGSNQWNRVASLLSRKTAAQCRSRWFEVLKPDLSHSEWSTQEDELLMELAHRMPNMWRSISATLGGRSAGQCHERYSLLVSNEELELQAKPGGISEEIGVDALNELKAEANARLANSLGRKAKRKQRERIEDEAKFTELMRQNRTQKRSKFLNSPQIDTNENGVNTDNSVSALTAVQASCAKNIAGTSTRSELKLSEPLFVNKTGRDHHLQHITLSSEVRRKLKLMLDDMPSPVND